MISLLASLAGGFLGSTHCIGMCGGFAATLGLTRRPFWPTMARQLVYNAGRIATYAFMGALAGSTGMYLSRITIAGFGIQQGFSLVAGALMLLLGLASLGVLRLPARWSRYSAGLFAPLFAYFLNARGWWGYFSAGLVNGFLPCGLVYSFLALAVACGTLTRGAMTMALFGLGTVPAMMLIGCGTRALTPAVRMRIFRGAAVLVVLLGMVTVWRALPARGESCCHLSETRLSDSDGAPGR